MTGVGREWLPALYMHAGLFFYFCLNKTGTTSTLAPPHLFQFTAGYLFLSSAFFRHDFLIRVTSLLSPRHSGLGRGDSFRRPGQTTRRYPSLDS